MKATMNWNAMLTSEASPFSEKSHLSLLFSPVDVRRNKGENFLSWEKSECKSASDLWGLTCTFYIFHSSTVEEAEASSTEYIPQGHWFYCSLYFIYHIFYAFLTVTLYYRREKSITKLPSQRCTLNDKSTTLYKFEILFVKEEMHSICWCSEYKSQLALSPENCPQSEALISSRPWHDFTLSRFVSVVSGINNTWDPVGSTSSRKACKMYSLTVQV